jgi:hypothetical protein
MSETTRGRQHEYSEIGAANGYEGEQPAARLKRLCAEGGFPLRSPVDYWPPIAPEDDENATRFVTGLPAV